jgi:predicted DsbA family dithiol-disulfide isomerase
MARRNSALGNVPNLWARKAEAGELAGIAFRHDLITRTPNTFDAHRLICLARKRGVQDLVIESLFRAYFVKGQDVGISKF